MHLQTTYVDSIEAWYVNVNNDGQCEVLSTHIRGTVVHKKHKLLGLHCSRNLKNLVTLVALVDLFTAFFILISVFVCSWTLIMEVTCASKQSVDFQLTALSYSPEDRTLQCKVVSEFPKKSSHE
jgi:hypothetical protein